MKINKMRMLASDKGFTLIELMIVIAIIGILAAIAIPNFITYRDKAFCTSAEKDAQSLQAALANYFSVPQHRGFNKYASLTGANTVGFGADVVQLSGNNTGAVRPVTGTTSFTITVTDGSGRCPDSYTGPQPNWTDSVYSVTMN